MRTNHYDLYWHDRNSKERIKQRSRGIQPDVESKEGQSYVPSQAHDDDTGQIRGENLRHKV